MMFISCDQNLKKIEYRSKSMCPFSKQKHNKNATKSQQKIVKEQNKLKHSKTQQIKTKL